MSEIKVDLLLAQALARREVEALKIDRHILEKYIPEDASCGFVEYSITNELFDLPVTERMDNEAWKAARSKHRDHAGPSDLPLHAFQGKVDQTTIEIAELSRQITADAQELVLNAIQRDTGALRETAGRVKLEVRAVEGLAKVQRDGIDMSDENLRTTRF